MAGFLLLVATAWAAHRWRDIPRVLAFLAVVPTVLAFLWGLALRRRMPVAGTTLLLSAMVLAPLNVFVAVLPAEAGPAVAGGTAAGLLILFIIGARALRTPGYLALAASAGGLAFMQLFIRDPLVLRSVAFGPYFEFVLLGLYALGAVGMCVPLYLRRLEVGDETRLGAKAGLLVLGWCFALSAVHLFVRDARSGSVLDSQWFGPWAMALGAVLLLCGLVFCVSSGPQRKAIAGPFGIVLVSLAGVSAAAGLLLAERHAVPLAADLAGLCVVTGMLGALLRSRGSKALRAIAAVAFVLLAAVSAMALSSSPIADGTHLLGRLPTDVGAAAGLSVGAAVVYVIGLLVLPRDHRWTHSVAAVAGMALGVTGFFALAMLDGQARFAFGGMERPVDVSSIQLMLGLAVLVTVTAWRLNWQPAVYLAALALLIVVGTWTPELDESGPRPVWLLAMSIRVATTGAAMTVLGALFALLGRKLSVARFYSEGLLVMGLAAATLMTLAALAGAGLLEAMFTDDTIKLLAALAVSLLVCSLVFRQEDLFGFFGFIVLLLVLSLFGTHGGATAEGYLGRYQTVALGTAIAFAAVAGVLGLALRSPPGLDRFGAALYVVAFAVAIVVTALLPLTGNFVWRGLDLAGMAVVLAFLRPHVRHPATGYAVAAAVVAAIFQLVAGAWGASSAEMHHASMIAAGALAVALLVTAHVLRHALLALTGCSDKEARRRSRPFTVVGMTLAVALAVYLSVQTALAYYRVWTHVRPLPSLTLTFDPASGLIAWGGVLLAFLVSIWLFRHAARTLGFFLVGSAATISAGPVFVGDNPRALLAYMIYAVGGYGAVHLLVYLWERPYMGMLSRVCALYKDEQHASTTIFTAAAISCFIGGTIAAFYLWTPAALVMMAVLTVVFGIWAFGQRRPEFLYPAAIISIALLLAIWHNIEGPGPWTPDRVTINALVFAVGAPLWLGIGSSLNRLRGPMSLLNAPARQMSVLLAVVGLGFYLAQAVSPLSHEPGWYPDNAADRFFFGTLCGLALVPYFFWAAASFRRTVLVYLSVVSLLVMLLFLGVRIPAVRDSAMAAYFWPLWAAGLALAVLALSRWLEHRRLVLFGRPLLYSAMYLLPMVALGGTAAALVRGHRAMASSTFLTLAAVWLLGARTRSRRMLLVLAALAIAGGAVLWRLSGGGLTLAAPHQRVAAALVLVAAFWLVLSFLRRKRG